MGKQEPPRTLADWQEWQRRCREKGKFGQWAAAPWVGGVAEGTPVQWVITAEDHPFKGQAFCWRCVAEAQGLAGTSKRAAHYRDPEVICWEAVGDPATEDRDPDTSEARIVPTVDEQGNVTAWFEVEGEPYKPRGVSIREPQAVDTGTIFWSPPPVGPLEAERRRAVERVAASLDLPSEAVEIVSEWSAAYRAVESARREALISHLEGLRDQFFEALRRDAATLAAEPGHADEPERPAQAAAEPTAVDHRDTWPPSWTDEVREPEGGIPPGAEPQP